MDGRTRILHTEIPNNLVETARRVVSRTGEGTSPGDATSARLYTGWDGRKVLHPDVA